MIGIFLAIFPVFPVPWVPCKNTEVKKWICFVCNHKAVEDKFNFLIQCPVYQEERTKMYVVYDTKIGSI